MAAVALLVTIPGIAERGAQNILAEIGADIAVFPHRQAPHVLGGPCPGNHQSAASSAPAGRARAPSGSTSAQGSRAGRDPDEEQLPADALSAPTPEDRARPRDRRRQTRHPASHLAHALTGETYRDLGGDDYRTPRPQRATDASSPSSSASDTPSPCTKQSRSGTNVFPFSGRSRRAALLQDLRGAVEHEGSRERRRSEPDRRGGVLEPLVVVATQPDVDLHGRLRRGVTAVW